MTGRQGLPDHRVDAVADENVGIEIRRSLIIGEEQPEEVDRTALLLSLVFMGLTLVLGVCRWRMVLRVQGLDLSPGRATEISFVAHFFNSFMLGSTGGDLLKAYYAARETHHKKAEAVVTVIVDRLLGLFAMLLFACLMMLPNLSLLLAHRRLAVLAGFILLMTACFLGFGYMGVPGGGPKHARGSENCQRASCWNNAWTPAANLAVIPDSSCARREFRCC